MERRQLLSLQKCITSRSKLLCSTESMQTGSCHALHPGSQFYDTAYPDNQATPAALCSNPLDHCHCKCCKLTVVFGSFIFGGLHCRTASRLASIALKESSNKVTGGPIAVLVFVVVIAPINIIVNSTIIVNIGVVTAVISFNFMQVCTGSCWEAGQHSLEELSKASRRVEGV